MNENRIETAVVEHERLVTQMALALAHGPEALLESTEQVLDNRRALCASLRRAIDRVSVLDGARVRVVLAACVYVEAAFGHKKPVTVSNTDELAHAVEAYRQAVAQAERTQEIQ